MTLAERNGTGQLASAEAASGGSGLPEWAARQTRGWLLAAITAVAVLAAASAVASWNAQFTAVAAVRHDRVIAAIEAGIPDAGALFFACLGIALALHGKRALRARALNACCVAVSLAMNAMASAPGWRDIAIWVMPSAMYAVASDTLIGVIRAFTAQRDEGPAAKIRRWAGGMLLWSLRLMLAFPSTFSGFRRWVVEDGPVAPGRRGSPTVRAGSSATGGQPATRLTKPASRPGPASKKQQMIAAAQGLADLSVIPLTDVPKLAAQAAETVGLHPTTARRQLRRYVLDLQSGGPGGISNVNGKERV
jgi:hypothetical protein